MRKSEAVAILADKLAQLEKAVRLAADGDGAAVKTLQDHRDNFWHGLCLITPREILALNIITQSDE